MKRLALVCALAGCGQRESLELHPAVEATPARKTAIAFARLNPEWAVGRVYPDGSSFEAQHRESGVRVLFPEAEVRGARVMAVSPCARMICMTVDGRRAESWEDAAPVGVVAAANGCETASVHFAECVQGGRRWYFWRRIGNVTRAFVVDGTSPPTHP